jgi:hypothetical protein
MSSILWLDTGPPNPGALTVTSRKGRRKSIDAGSDASKSIIAQGRRSTQLLRFCRPLVAVRTALEWREWEELRVRAQRKENGSCRP